MSADKMRDWRLSDSFLAFLSGDMIGIWARDLKDDSVVLSGFLSSVIECSPKSGETDHKTMRSVVHRDDIAIVRAHEEACVSGGEALHGQEYRVLGSGGETVWLSEICRVSEFDGDGAPLVLVGLVRDITALKRAAEGAANTARVYKAVFNSDPLIGIIFDIGGRAIDCNQSAVEHFGADSKEQLIQNALDVLSSEIPKYQTNGRKSFPFAVRFKLALENEYHEFTTELLHEGVLRSYGVVMKRIPYGESFAVAVYLTERSEAEQQMQAMLDAVPYACTVIDRNGIIIDCNEETLRICGLRWAHEYAERYREFLPQFQPDGSQSIHKMRQMIAAAFKSDDRVVFPFMYLLTGGEPLPVEITMQKYKWRDTEMVIAYARDLREIQKSMDSTERARKTTATIFDANPHANILFDDRRMVIDCNPEAVKFFGFASKRELQNALSCRPGEYFIGAQPGEASLPERIDSVFREGYQEFEAEIISQGHIVPVSVILKRITYEDAFGVVAYMIDLSEIKRANSELYRQARLLEAVNTVAALLLENKQQNFFRTLQQVLQILGEAVGADRVSMWRNYRNEDKKLCSIRLPGWIKDCPPELDVPGTVMDYASFLPEWDDGAEVREDINLPRKDMRDEVREFYILRRTESLLLSPIIMQGDFWGFVGFSHNDADYIFGKTERGILRSAGMMIASGIIRNEMSNSLLQAEILASTDSLTQLPNRHSFMMHAQSIFESHRERGEETAILFLDIDYFKKVNDRYGHQFGDEVLIRFAHAIQSNIRPGDLCCRYGGEEFLIMLIRPGRAGGPKIAQRIMDEVDNIAFVDKPGFRFSTSIGLVSTVPREGDTLEELIMKSDQALYEAKNTGRHKIVAHRE